MRSCLIFTGKEIREHIRSYRLLILGIVFILFGIMSPATAKLTPEILKMVGTGSGISVTLPPVTVLDSYVQFFKNMNSIGVIIILLVFAGLVVDEKVKGSASLILTKNLSGPAFLLAKYAAAALLWTVIFAVGVLVCQGYTLWLFPGETAANLFLGFSSYWLYGLLLLAITTLASVLAKGHGLATLGAFAGWGLLLLSMIPAKIARYSPAALGSMNLPLIAGSTQSGDLLIPSLLALALILLCLGGAAWSLSRQEL
jgi:ABC-2 type transport system permease protein